MLNRCCHDSIDWANLKAPTEGLEIPCRWCSGYLRYERIGSPQFFRMDWVFHDTSTSEARIAARVQAMSS